jgi:hypothetical protein
MMFVEKWFTEVSFHRLILMPLLVGVDLDYDQSEDRSSPCWLKKTSYKRYTPSFMHTSRPPLAATAEAKGDA